MSPARGLHYQQQQAYGPCLLPASLWPLSPYKKNAPGRNLNSKRQEGVHSYHICWIQTIKSPSLKGKMLVPIAKIYQTSHNKNTTIIT
jgi:hypothetical protein